MKSQKRAFLCTIIIQLALILNLRATESMDNSMRDTLFECSLPNFSSQNYLSGVDSLFQEYEKASGKEIKKGEKGKVGIKIYTNSGYGLTTPKFLVDAVIEELKKRGYESKDITLVDMSIRKMRESGFLPKLSQLQEGISDTYNGVNVADIQSGKYFDKKWFYDNPLMPKIIVGGRQVQQDIYNLELRKSYLPVPLFLTVDFWINLPVITDMEGLGVCSALGNISIWNMSNNERFLKQPANASMAAAEVCAIPELKNSLIFTILSLEKGQYVGGAIFNSRCTFSENKLFMSANPVILDHISWELLNKYRKANKFKAIEPMPTLLTFAKELNLGDWDIRNIKKIVVPYKAK